MLNQNSSRTSTRSRQAMDDDLLAVAEAVGVVRQSTDIVGA